MLRGGAVGPGGKPARSPLRLPALPGPGGRSLRGTWALHASSRTSTLFPLDCQLLSGKDLFGFVTALCIQPVAGT